MERGRTSDMHATTDISPVDLDQYLRRGRQLRSDAAVSAFAGFGRAFAKALERAFIRSYRMARTPGCCGEA